MSGAPHPLRQDIERELAFCSARTGLDHLDERVLAAIEAIPRAEFVPPELRPLALRDGPLPIGLGQTISQPFIVALMTHLLAPRPEHRCLEVGTGSGYQAALLSILVAEVYSIEILAPLAGSARDRLARLGHANVRVRHGDGRAGWPEAAPFDGIVVTAATPVPAPAWIEQLRPGGALVAPIGPPGGTQILRHYTKLEDGRVLERDVLEVVFVPLTGTPA